ncbi:ATP-dependent helicase/deoxyribonuclease subunit B [Bacilli bacterium]|nr:ATP-dependent helicase/deoxyribonuclease subunit B [Bacilli bacterium]
MKVIHTDIYGHLTEFLVDEAREHIASGKKIFYIVPSSLSFEKEKEILTRFNAGQDGALFDLTVTRLKQLPWYFDKNQDNGRKTLSTIGLAMLMRQTLKQLSDDQIPIYRFMRDKQGFITQLVALYQELTTANLQPEDLLLAADSQKNQELMLIFEAFEYQLGHFSNENKLQGFIDNLVNDELTHELQNYVLIIEGYSRFSAEEMTLIDVLSSRVSDLVLGIYASKKAMSATFIEGNVYQQSVALVQTLAQKYELIVIYKDVNYIDNTFTKLSTLMEKASDFTLSDSELLEKHDGLEIWQVVNHKEEIEHVAKQIRQLLFEGVKYQDILVLLGDVASDRILLPEIFKTYDIPFFYAQEKSMKDHPLIVLVEALLKIKTNHYQLNDVLNLLKTELYTDSQISLQDIYKFEIYSLQRNIRGRTKFAQEFEDIKAEKVRKTLINSSSPLQVLLGSQPQKGQTWVKKFQTFLETGQVKAQLEQLYFDAETAGNFEKASEHLEVWKLLMAVLEEFTAVFGLEKLSIQKFLEIIEAGIKNAAYRLVPANVDVVQVKSYELVEPHTADYVFAIGLTQSNFPKSHQNTSLISDEERAKLNQTLHDADLDYLKYIDEPNFINYKKNSFTALQLFNAANKKLVLSTPEIYSNEQSELSQFLQFIIDRGVTPLNKQGVNLVDTMSQIGNYDGLLANLGQIERLLMSREESKEMINNTSFWLSLFRIMSKNPDYQHILSAVMTDQLEERQLTPSVITALYPSDLNASVSSFENFYNCEYQYFINNTLHIKAFEKIDLDSRISGSYFHEVFENVMQSSQVEAAAFDDILTQSLQEVDSKYLEFFTRDATSRYTWSRLQDIIRQTSTMLKQTLENTGIQLLAFEQAFGFDQAGLQTYQVDLQDNKKLNLRGMIDRVDRIFETLGAVDYKSGDKKFELQSAYDGTSLQFLTYLDILRQNAKQFGTSQTIWGALYLHLQNPTIALKSVNQISDISDTLKNKMRYTGFFNVDLASHLKENFDHLFNLGQFTKEGLPYKNNANFYSEPEISALMRHNETLYQEAGQKILSGKIEINPVVVKHHAKGCQFCQFKSICGFEADLHLPSGRKVNLKSKEDIRASLLTGGKEHATTH